MKINIWKLLLVAMVVPAVMGACKDDRNNYMVDDSISYVDSDGTWEEAIIVAKSSEGASNEVPLAVL